MNDDALENLARQRKINDIDTKIEHMTLARSQIPDDHPNMPGLLAQLGFSHNERYGRLGALSDIDKAIEYTSLTLALTPEGHPFLPDGFANLGVFHSNRFERLGQLSDLENAMKYESRAVSLTPDGHPELSGRLQNLGLFLNIRFKHLGELADLDKAVEYQARAVTLTPDYHPHLSARLQNLGLSLRIRYERLGELADLEKALDYESRAVLLTLNGDPQLSARLQNLGASHARRFERLGELADLDKAIEYESRAVILTPDGHPDLPGGLQNLGASLSIRFERLGKLDDLDKAIEYESRAVALTADDHPLLSSRLHNLGGSYTRRFERLGELGDLGKAIECESRSVALTPNGHPHLSGRLQNLGLSLRIRFERLGELADLDKAIECESHALDLTPQGHSDLSARLQNLGASLRIRYECLRELADLEKTIDYESRAVALTADDHPLLSSRFQNLGGSFIRRFERLGELGDLDKAIEYGSRAVVLTPEGHPELSARLYNLGMSHTRRFRHHLQKGSQSAIDRISRSIEPSSHGHPDLSDRHSALENDRSDLQQSLYCYRMASQSPSGSPREKFRYALWWAKEASHDPYLNPIEAYQTAIGLLPQYVWLGATTAQRYEDLTRVENLAVNAADAAILASNGQLALEWLEHARCVVWNQSLMLRSPLDDLSSCDPDLATRLQTVAAELHNAGSESRESQSLIYALLTPEQVAQRHHQFAQEYDQLISQARTLPGFTGFLQPIKAASLVRAARYGPVVVINCHQDRCDALIIIPEQDHVDHIPLPRFTAKRAQNIRKKMESAVIDTRQRERGAELFSEVEQEVGFESILADLWHDIVKPVLDFLGFLKDSQAGTQPHITWCATGAISFLPLHAAGDYGSPGSRVFDYVISSYTPTLTAILPSASSLTTGTPRVLAIAQPNTPDHTRLPGTVEEIGYLNNYATGKFECTQLVGDQATTTTVLNAMEQHDWVHLACHAHQNIQDPTKSGFFLHDGTLDLASINRRSFKKKGLAFLSACQTATGDEKLPDEAIHLASSMLMAGYSSVIGTMWSVMDDDAPFVADKVYGQLIRDGKVGNGEAGKALHYAVAELRKKVGEKKFGRWVPYIHIGS